MPLRPARVGRVGVIGAPVEKTAVVAAAGLLFLSDEILWHPDPQGGIAVFFTPIYQVLALIVLLPVCKQIAEKRLRRNTDAAPPDGPVP